MEPENDDALGIGLSRYAIPEEEPILYLGTASAGSLTDEDLNSSFEYTASWQHDIDESGFEDLFNNYARDGELYEARTPRQFLGIQLPFSKKIGEIGVNQEEQPHQADYFEDGDFILTVPSTDTDSLRYYFPETVSEDLSEQEVLQVLEEAESAIEEDSRLFDH